MAKAAKKARTPAAPRKTKAERDAAKILADRKTIREDTAEQERVAGATQIAQDATGKGKVRVAPAPEVGSTSGELGAIDAPKKKRTAHDVSDKETGMADKFHARMDEEAAAINQLGIHTQARLRAEADPWNAPEEDRRRVALSKELGVNVFPREADETDLPAQAV